LRQTALSLHFVNLDKIFNINQKEQKAGVRFSITAEAMTSSTVIIPSLFYSYFVQFYEAWTSILR
jgi:hypothetical protein